MVHHERAPSQELEKDRYPTARCTVPGLQRLSFTPEYTFMAAGVLRLVFVYDLSLSLSLSPYLRRLFSRHSGYCQGCVSCFWVFSSWLSCLALVSLASDGELTLAPSPGIPKKFLVGLKRTWNQKLSPGLMLLTFMNALSDSEFIYKRQSRRFWQFPHFLRESGLRTLRSMCCLRWSGLEIWIFHVLLTPVFGGSHVKMDPVSSACWCRLRSTRN